MKQAQIIYPDVSDILARKQEGRREISRRSFGEKIAMVETMRERLAPLKRIPHQNLATVRASTASNSACVPINLTNTICRRKSNEAINR